MTNHTITTEQLDNVIEVITRCTDDCKCGKQEALLMLRGIKSCVNPLPTCSECNSEVLYECVYCSCTNYPEMT